MIVELSPVELDIAVSSKPVYDWVRKNNSSILWVTGQCGTGKTFFVNKLISSLFSMELDKKIHFIRVEEYSGIEDIEVYINGIISRFEFDIHQICIIIDGPEFLDDYKEYLCKRTIYNLPAEIHVVIISRYAPVNLLSDPELQRMIHQIVIRPLGLKETLNLLPGISPDRVGKLYVDKGGRFSFLINNIKSEEFIVCRFLREASCKKYDKQLYSFKYFKCFDKRLFELLPQTDESSWREFIRISFISYYSAGYRIDPVLRKNMPEHECRKNTQDISDLLYDYIIENGYGSFQYVMNLLAYCHPCLPNGLKYCSDPLSWFRSYKPCCHVDEPLLNCFFDLSREQHDLSKHIISVLSLKDPTGEIVAVLKLVRENVKEPFTVLKADYNVILGDFIIFAMINKIIELCCQGETIILPACNEAFNKIFFELEFPVIEVHCTVYSGKAFLCCYTLKGIIPWVNDLINKRNQKENQYIFTFTDILKLLKDVLRNYHNDTALRYNLIIRIFKESGLIKTQQTDSVQTLRKIMLNYIDKLSKEDGLVIFLSYIHCKQRTDIAQRMNISERSLYRRLNKAVNALAQSIYSDIKD